MSSDISIYIHIPFCSKKCFYCDFVSLDNKTSLIESYIDALCSEILSNAEILSQHKIKTVYFGGGTPSFIDSKYITKIMEVINLFSTSDIKEVTIELNPNSVTLDKLAAYKACGINRLSIGLQSTHDKILRTIGRQHTYKDFKDTLELSKNAYFTNISLDLIYPLPGLNISMFKDSLNSIIKLKDDYNIKHISVYNLEVHENTRLDFLLKEGYLSLCKEDEEYEMRNVLNDTLIKNGYNKYEISNYAIPNYESSHNISYWNQDMYLGFGLNASSFFNGIRYKNTSNIEEYIDKINNNISTTKESIELDKLELMKEYIILRLRLSDGVIIEDFKRKFECNISDIFGDEINTLIEQKLIINDKNNIRLTKRGEEVANLVWEKFI